MYTSEFIFIILCGACFRFNFWLLYEDVSSEIWNTQTHILKKHVFAFRWKKQWKESLMKCSFFLFSIGLGSSRLHGHSHGWTRTPKVTYIMSQQDRTFFCLVGVSPMYSVRWKKATCIESLFCDMNYSSLSAWLASQGSINSRKIPLESFIHAPSILDHSVLNLILIRMLKLSRETGVTQHLLSFSLTPRDLNQHSTSSITTQSASSSASGPSSSASGVASGGGGAGLRQCRGGSWINMGWRTWSCSCSMPASWGGQRFRSTSEKSTCKVRQTRHFHTQGWHELKINSNIYTYIYHILFNFQCIDICTHLLLEIFNKWKVDIYIYTYLHILNLFLINLFDVTWFATWLVEWICPKNDTTCFWILRSCLREDSQLPPTHRRQQNCRFVAHKLQCRCHGLQEQIMIQQKNPKQVQTHSDNHDSKTNKRPKQVYKNIPKSHDSK